MEDKSTRGLRDLLIRHQAEAKEKVGLIGVDSPSEKNHLKCGLPLGTSVASSFFKEKGELISHNPSSSLST